MKFQYKSIMPTCNYGYVLLRTSTSTILYMRQVIVLLAQLSCWLRLMGLREDCLLAVDVV
jgi:hypothetical protein